MLAGSSGVRLGAAVAMPTFRRNPRFISDLPSLVAFRGFGGRS
jgi:hypothetical protein